MKRLTFSAAVDGALAAAMAADPDIIVMGEDVSALHTNLATRFGNKRLLNAPISESAFIGAAVGAAMGGMRPVAEVYMVDFLGVAMDALINQAAMIDTFSGGRWPVPLVVRAPCSAGYGDGGQHGQSLWGWLAHIPGLSVVVPSNPADAGSLLTTAIHHNGPSLFLEPKLLTDTLLDGLGYGGRNTVTFDIPEDGRRGPVPARWKPLPMGQAAVVRDGADITLVSVGVGVHRCIEAAKILSRQGKEAGVVDLRFLSPLDRDTVLEEARKTSRVVVVDEDYREFGLSGEIAAVLLEEGMNVAYARVAVDGTIPFARHLEEAALPSAGRIVEAASTLFT